MENARKRNIRFTIRRKLLAITLVLLIVPIAVLGSIGYYVSYKETNKLIEKNIQNSVELVLAEIASMDESVKKGTITLEQAQENMKTMLLGPKQDGKRPINKDIDLGPNGYFFVLDAKGTELAHPSLEGQNIWDKQTKDGTYFIRDMIGKAQQGGGFTYYSWPLPNQTKEAMKVTYAELAPQWGWVVCAGSYMMDYNAGQTRILHAILWTFIGCFAVGAIILLLFSLHISRPLAQMARTAEFVAEGDLTAPALSVTNKDEIGWLSESFNRMTGTLRQLTGQLGTSSDGVSEASVRLATAIRETTDATTSMSVAIQEMADSVDVQARSVQESARTMEEMATGIQRIAVTSSTAYESSAATLQEAEAGNAASERMAKQMNAVRSTVGELAGVVNVLNDRSEQIGAIVQSIKELSYQTNLLALNASIEAARAGEHGKGFAVVAAEVKKLAARSNASAVEVETLIAAVQSDIGGAVAAMDRGEREVQTGVETLRETSEAFRRIVEATRHVVDQVQETSAAMEQMSAGTEQVAASLLEMERSAARAADSTQSIAATAQEQLATMESIEASAESLNEMSLALQKGIHRFKV